MPETKTPKQVSHSILLGVDGSRNALQALEYSARITEVIPDLDFELLQVLAAPPPYLTEGAKTDPGLRKKLRKLQEANTARARQSLEEAREFLLRREVAPDRVRIKIRPRQSGLAQDILTEAEQGHYDALVVGRRGLTRAQELFIGSVSNRLVHHAVNVPLWLVEGKVTEPTKVLVAVDGSEASLRAVDYVGFMLGRSLEAEVTFLHVRPKFQSYCPIDLDQAATEWADLEGDLQDMEEVFQREDEACLDDFFARAQNILQEAGFSPARIKFEEQEVVLGVARTILKAAREEGFGTVVLGRRGIGQSFFLGRVSDRVVQRMEDLALWLVS